MFGIDLEPHDNEHKRFQFTGPAQRAGVDRAKAGSGHYGAEPGFGFFGVPGDEDIQRNRADSTLL
ncbi:hypothetical protein DDA93_15475 [Arthrobacter sp. Bz4]|nr:hypothetical protein DDA93_15475 [Arthrobacter sp. Bz4]